MGPKSETGNFADHWHAAEFRFTNKVQKQGFGDLGVIQVSEMRCGHLVSLSVYGNPPMILNPRCKLSMFGEETWSNLDPEEYSDRCRKRFQFD
jgi:hypothetical protein